MARYVELDRSPDGAFVVSWYDIHGRKEKRFDTRSEAEVFGELKMNKRNGQLVSTLDMTPEQRTALEDRKRRAADIVAKACQWESFVP